MSWIFLLKSILKLGSLLAGIVQQKQLIDAGEAKAVSKGLADATQKMDQAQQSLRDLNIDGSIRSRLRKRYRAPNKD